MSSSLHNQPELATPAGDQHLSVLRKHYDVPVDQPVPEFLKQYPFIAALLMEGIDPLKQFFGDTATPVLELLEEDDAEKFTELFVTVRTSLEPQIASAKLDDFDRAWWLEASVRAEGRLNFTVETL
jgi:hypothetical protein